MRTPLLSALLTGSVCSGFQGRDVVPATLLSAAYPAESVAHHMPLAEVRRFNLASIEFSTNNRTYCANLHCSAFIPPNDIHADIAKCGLCRQHTCTICKQKSHVGDCPHDLSIQNTLDMASDKGWRRCSNCQRMVELNLGCNHIKLVETELTTMCLCSPSYQMHMPC